MSPQLSALLDKIVHEIKSDSSIPQQVRTMDTSRLKRYALDALTRYVCKDDGGLEATLQITGVVLALARLQLESEN